MAHVLHVAPVASPEQLAMAYDVRVRVYQREYGLDPALDIIPLDTHAGTVHYVGWLDAPTPTAENVIAAARCTDFGDGRAEIGRVVVLHEWQRRGFGRQLMAFVEADAPAHVHTFVVSACPDKVAFNGKLGYVDKGTIDYRRNFALHEMEKRRVGPTNN